MGQLHGESRRHASPCVIILLILTLLCLSPVWADGQYCLQFDGSNDYVDLGSASSLQFAGEITLEAWI
jgi:hypothetical protein